MSGKGKDDDSLLHRQLRGSDLEGHVRPGKQGIKAIDRKRFEEKDGKFRASLDFDDAKKKSEPTAPRWDYVVSIEQARAERVEAAEVHPALAREIDVLIKKKAWSAPVLAKAGAKVLAWHWIATDSGIGFRRGGAEEKRLAAAGIVFPKRKLVI